MTTPRTAFDTIRTEVEAVLPVDDNPQAIAVSHDGSRVYLTHYASGVLSVIDTGRLTVIAKYQLGFGLDCMAVSDDDSAIFVANQARCTVRRLDAASGRVETEVGIDGLPTSLCTGPGGRLYAACGLENRIEVLDQQLTRRAQVTGVNVADGLAAAPNGYAIYASHFHNGIVTVLQAGSIPFEQGGAAAAVVDRVITTPRSPRGLGLNGLGSRLYVAHALPQGLVSVIDTQARRVVGTIPFGKLGSVQGVAASPDGTRLYTTNGDANSISVLRAPPVTPVR